MSKTRRLDRIVSFDEKSRAYPVRLLPGLAAKQPRSYTWRCDTWLDQGSDGACVGFAVSHELAARPSVVAVTNKFAKEKVYWEAQKIDEWAGGAYPGAVPFYEGTSVLAGVKVAHKLGAMDSYRWSFNMDDLLLGLSYAGPAVLGLNWYSGMFEPDDRGFIHRTGQVEGGHAILAIGHSIKKQAVRLHNSWGKSWGDGGRAWISYTDLRRLLAEAGEACFFVGRKKITV